MISEAAKKAADEIITHPLVMILRKEGQEDFAPIIQSAIDAETARYQKQNAELVGTLRTISKYFESRETVLERHVMGHIEDALKKAGAW